MEKADPRECVKCKIVFSPLIKYDYVKMCFPCWKANDNDVAPNNEVMELNRQIASLKASMRVVDKSNESLFRQLAQSVNENMKLKNKVNILSKKESTKMSPEKIRRLLMLCHPDKHDNSDNANKMTTWLLGFRR